jgi:alpha-tubulin suppressor-like RCC1 family protein
LFSLVLTKEGELITWGDNAFGQLGDGTVQSVLMPRYMPRTNTLFDRTFVDVAAGYEHVIALTSNCDLSLMHALTTDQMPRACSRGDATRLVNWATVLRLSVTCRNRL